MAEKFLQLQPDGSKKEIEAVTTSVPNRIPALDSTGRFNQNMMPTGVGSSAKAIIVGSDVTAGDVVNIYNDNGVCKCRPADATAAAAKRAHGFVLESVVANGTDTANVYLFPALITGKTGLVPGATYFLGKIPGSVTTDISGYTAGDLIQEIGVAVSSTELECQESEPIIKG